MNSNRLVCCCLMILGSLTLISCAKTAQIKELSSEIQDINNKVDKIHDNCDLLQSQVDHNKNEAIRANKRLDNQIPFYHK